MYYVSLPSAQQARKVDAKHYMVYFAVSYIYEMLATKMFFYDKNIKQI